MCVCVCVYVYRERERGRERETDRQRELIDSRCCTTKSNTKGEKKIIFDPVEKLRGS